MALTTILAGCDLSVSSDNAIERAIALALRHRARLVLVNAQTGEPQRDAVDNVMYAQLGEVSAAIRAEEAVRITTKLAEIRALGLAASVISRVGPPDEVLAAVATEERAELIIVGTHGHGSVGRFLLGSVANAVIRNAPCDVLVVRGAPLREAYRKPLLATDFSPASSQALRSVREVVDEGAPLAVVHAWELPAGSWGATLLGQARFPWSTVRDAVLASAREQAAKLVAAHDHAFEVELVQGLPGTVLPERAERGGHDLIVVGAHGHRGFRRWLLGSVAESAARHAPCSVLVAHAPA